MKRIVGTQAAFALAFSLSAQEKPCTVYLVGTARFDNQWNWDVRVPYYSDSFGQWSWKGECEGYLKDGSFGCIANHKHSERKGNDSYNFAYLYKVCLDIPEDARTLTLPKDAGIAVFAATLADDPNHDTIDVSPMRIIPAQTVPVEYTTRPVPFFRERSLW